ncbi:hypothetical protein Pelo_16603 [Pelomyxa schiedti]|nr:hypothetical protein Pelo_16603 [Pelomyxa schiedti]
MWYDWTVECVRQDISNTFGGVEANMIVYIAYGEAREYILVKEKYCSGSDYLLRPISPWFLEDATCTGETVYILDKPCDHWQIVDPDMEYNFYVVQGTNILMRVYDTGAYENATVDFLDFTETKFTDNSFIVPPPVCYPSTK